MIGHDGEITCYQMLPSTYKLYSIQVLGYVAEPTPANAEYIATVKMERMSHIYTPEQIFLKWNAGERTKKCAKGYNKNNNYYNSCEYVNTAMSYYKELK